MSESIYATVATSTGDGRAGGRATTDVGFLDVTSAIPKSMGGPGGTTNPAWHGRSLGLVAASPPSREVSASAGVGNNDSTISHSSSIRTER